MTDTFNARMVLFGVTAISYAIVLSLVRLVDMKVDFTGVAPSCLAVAFSTIAASYICAKRQLYKLRAIIENYFCCLLLVFPEVLSVYLADRISAPWADAQLSAMDGALGWDWRAVIYSVDRNAILSLALRVAYSSFSFQLASIPILLSARGHLARAHHMVIISALMCFVSAVISVWFPAVGTYVFYEIDTRTLHNLDTTSPYVFLTELINAKEDPDFIFSLTRAEGIVTFPSMHAAMAVLCAWAVWPIKSARYPFLLLNVLMGFAAMIVSNHYLVDVIAGIGVAGLCISGLLALVTSPARQNRATSCRVINSM